MTTRLLDKRHLIHQGMENQLLQHAIHGRVRYRMIRLCDAVKRSQLPAAQW